MTELAWRFFRPKEEDMKRKILALTLMMVAIPLLAWALVRIGYKAQLTGSAVVPPVKTEAQGSASFDFIKDFNSLNFKLSVQNLSNVTAAHIHLGAVGKEGPPVVTLYPFGKSPPVKEGIFSGLLAEGVITAANLEGPLKGKSPSALSKEILGGNAYIKIHTKQNPDGELRGQIVRRPS
jgi:hypothetical protein